MKVNFQVSIRYNKSIRSKAPHYFLILLLFFSSVIKLSAQDFPIEYKNDSSFLNNLFGQHKEKNFKITPLPYLGYLPETRLLGGLALLLTCRASKDSTLPFSYSELTFTFTQNRQAVLEEDIFFYIGHHYILKGYFGYEKYPDRFWGIGPATLPGAEERYSSDRIFANLSLLRKVKGRFYVGVKYRMISIFNMNYLRGSHNLTPEEYKGNRTGGFGPAFIYDTRDNILTPSKGLYISVLNTNYGKLTGSSFRFSSYELDSRKFIRINSKQVLAFQVTANFIAGTPPFNMYALLGSDMDMRGYYKGRFRDKDYMATQVEYRRYLFWRIGMAVFAGVGNVNDNVGNLLSTVPKYSIGGGLRLKVNRKDNINLRMDYAWGNSPNSGLYAYLSEAF
jgi:hypothetical protein